MHFAWPDGRRIFAGLDGAFPGASVTAIVGPNGSGKTTLLRLIAGLETPQRGRIVIAGQGWIGAVMQSADRHVLCSTVEDEVAVTPRMLGLPDPRAVARQALAQLGLGALAARHPLDLDAGARRLVGLASAIAHRPPVLLLDEVQRGLDRLYRARLQAAIGAEAARGAAVLLVSHDADFIRRTAGRVIDLAAQGGTPLARAPGRP
nr:ABC transporter ATP-binding protein [Paracoccus shandongensis]